MQSLIDSYGICILEGDKTMGINIKIAALCITTLSIVVLMAATIAIIYCGKKIFNILEEKSKLKCIKKEDDESYRYGFNGIYSSTYKILMPDKLYYNDVLMFSVERDAWVRGVKHTRNFVSDIVKISIDYHNISLPFASPVLRNLIVSSKDHYGYEFDLKFYIFKEDMFINVANNPNIDNCILISVDREHNMVYVTYKEDGSVFSNIIEAHTTLYCCTGYFAEDHLFNFYKIFVNKGKWGLGRCINIDNEGFDSPISIGDIFSLMTGFYPEDVKIRIHKEWYLS